MITEQLGEFEVLSDGRTVWVNGPPNGWCLARFGPQGWDCAEATMPHRGQASDWQHWVGRVQQQYGVAVAEKHRPEAVAR